MYAERYFRDHLTTEKIVAQQHRKESKIITPERPKMKRRTRNTIDMMIRHHRNSSLSSLGSGDWGSDVGTSIEDGSTASDQSNRMRIVAEMAILASSSPEIKALTRRRSEGFQPTLHASNILPSPGSSVASSTVSRASISVTSHYEVDRETEESKCQENGATRPTQSGVDPIAALSFENLRIEPPPTPRREQVSDIASIIDSDSKENIMKRYHHKSNVMDANNNGQGQRTRRHTNRGTQRESFGSGLLSGSTRPPKPLKFAPVTPRSPARRPSMHRRASFDSLPTPSEICASTPSLVYSSSSDRSLFSAGTPSSERSGQRLGSSSEHTQKAHNRRGTSRLVAPRSLNLSKFYC